MKSITISLIITVFSVTSELYSQMLWPVQPQNQPHTIAGTVGEYRTYSRFHKGIDILNGNDHNIYAVESGTFGEVIDPNSVNSTIQICGASGITKYTHVSPLTGLVTNMNIAQGQLIGTMYSQTNIHVHFYSSTSPNMLAHRLCNYVDNTAPLIQTVSFRQNGLSLTNNTPAFQSVVPVPGNQCTIVYNKVDIMARISDMIGGYTCAPDRISYEIFNQNNMSIDNGPVCNLNFEQTCENAAGLYCFGYGTSFSPAVYNYVLTAHSRTLPYNRYWNTGLLNGATENWSGNVALNARLNQECHYPDGMYNVQIDARDVDYDNTFNHTVRNCPVVVDNFRPYVSNVIVRKENETGQLVYNGEWNWNAGVLSYSNPVNITAFNPNKMWIKIITSESMSDVWLQSGSFSGALIEAVPGTLGREWVFIIPVSSLVIGLNHLKIQGHDLAGNQMEAFLDTEPRYASEIPIHRIDGSWSPFPDPGSDYVHTFQIQIQNAPVANFIPQETTVNIGDNVVFTDLSTGNPIQWDWSFDGGDPAYSSLQNPIVTFNYEGDYVVMLLVINQTGMNTISGVIHVTPDIISPIAAFSPDFINVAPGTVVDFADLSIGNPDFWEWDFAGGAPSSYLQNPEVEFNTPGQYSVTFKAGNSAGTSMAHGTVNVSYSYTPIVVMCSAAPFMAVVGTPIYFSGTVLGGTPPYEFLIDPGDGTMHVVIDNSPNFGIYQTFDLNGDYPMSVTVIDAYGNTGTCYESVTIFGANPCATLHADFITAGGPLAVAVNSACSFIDQTSGGTPPYLYAWHFYPDQLTNSPPSVSCSFSMTPPPVVYSQAGNYPVSLHVYDNMGCTQTVVKDISAFVPQHCLVAKINIGDQNYHKIRKGNSCFWDFSYSLSDYNCSDPPLSGNMPCETDGDWYLLKYPSGNQLAHKHTKPHDPSTCMTNTVNDLLFQYNLTQVGKYKLKLNIYDNSCSVQTGYVCQDETSILLDVIDCNSHLDVCGLSLSAGNYSDAEAGTIDIGGDACGVKYMNGSHMTYHGYDQISIFGEVIVTSGAEFHADIQECPETMPCEKVQDITPDFAKSQVPIVYPNPSTGVVTIDMGETDEMYTLVIQNTRGQTILSRSDCNDKMTYVDLSKSVPGLYILKIITKQNLYTSRIEIVR